MIMMTIHYIICHTAPNNTDAAGQLTQPKGIVYSQHNTTPNDKRKQHEEATEPIDKESKQKKTTEETNGNRQKQRTRANDGYRQ